MRILKYWEFWINKTLNKVAAPFAVKQKSDSARKKAVVLFSSGLDSTTCLYWALANGYTCETLSISYGQRHEKEIQTANKIGEKLGIKQHFLTLDLPWLSPVCSLIDSRQKLPDVPVESSAMKRRANRLRLRDLRQSRNRGR